MEYTRPRDRGRSHGAQYVNTQYFDPNYPPYPLPMGQGRETMLIDERAGTVRLDPYRRSNSMPPLMDNHQRTYVASNQVYPPVGSLTTTTLLVLGYYLTITPVEINQWRNQRLRNFTSNGDYLHDLMSASFVPLSYNSTDPDAIRSQASKFLSAFDDYDANWEINVESLPIKQGALIHGTTARSRDTSVKGRFLRFRFPHVRFEWQIESPYSTVDDLYHENVEIEVLWKAWARKGPFANLVAYGSCTDTLRVLNRALIIKKRKFTVINVLHPELMTPIPYPLPHLPLKRNDDILVFSTSQTIIQYLRSSQRIMSALAAFSALLASLQPIIDRQSRTGGLILAGIGITAATISVLSLLVDWLLKWIEANAARHRQ